MAVWVVVRLGRGLGGSSLAGSHGDDVGNVGDVVVGDNIALVVVWDGDGAGGEGRDRQGVAHFREMLCADCGVILMLFAGSRIRLTVYA